MTLQETIIAQLGVKPSIDPKEEIRKSVDFLKAYMLKHPFLKTYVLGISGGQDSTLAGRLAQLAIEELRAETGKDYQFKGRYEAEKNAVIISLEKDEREC